MTNGNVKNKYHNYSPKVSIIMPVYNSEKFVGEAIESVLSQDFEDFELLIIDDGSTDNSGFICDKYVKKDNRVKVFHKKNGGVSSARNKGLLLARGEYVGFCDNDDVFLPHLIKDNYNLGKKYNADIIKFSRYKVSINSNNKVCKLKTNMKDGVVYRTDFAKEITEIRRDETVWSGLYKLDTIKKNHIIFPETIGGNEDIIFSINLLKYSNVVVLNSKVYYQWNQRESHSTSINFQENYINSIFLELKSFSELCTMLTEEGQIFNNDKLVVTRAEFLFMILSYHLCLDDCFYSMKKKCDILDSFRNYDFFKCDLNDDITLLEKHDKRLVPFYKLYVKKRYKLLLFLFKYSRKILYFIRYKV